MTRRRRAMRPFILHSPVLDHHLTEHLSINVLAGPSFRFFKNDGNTINPYAEVKVDYQGGNHSLNWTTTYGVEQPSQTFAAGATTLRSGLNLDVRSNFADQIEGRSFLSSRGKPSRGDRGGSCKHFDKRAGFFESHSRPQVYHQ